jgi:hypothetical protein
MNKKVIKLYVSKSKKQKYAEEAKNREMSLSDYLQFLIANKKIPPTRTDTEMAAKLLNCLPLIEEINTPENQEKTKEIKAIIESVVKEIYEIN